MISLTYEGHRFFEKIETRLCAREDNTRTGTRPRYIQPPRRAPSGFDYWAWQVTRTPARVDLDPTPPRWGVARALARV
jgi:hypothetical protein